VYNTNLKELNMKIQNKKTQEFVGQKELNRRKARGSKVQNEH